MDQYCRRAKEKICIKSNKERILKIFVHAVLRNKYNFILKWFNLNLIFILFINVQKCAKLRPTYNYNFGKNFPRIRNTCLFISLTCRLID